MDDSPLGNQGRSQARKTDFFNILKRKDLTPHTLRKPSPTGSQTRSHSSNTQKSSAFANMNPLDSSPSQLIVHFYDPHIQAKDGHGRTLEDVLSWDDVQLERSHNYIQMLFPLPEGSMFNWDAPVIDLEVMTAFRSRDELRAQLRRSFERMLTFYGFATYNSRKDNSDSEEDKEAKLGAQDSNGATEAAASSAPSSTETSATNAPKDQEANDATKTNIKTDETGNPTSSTPSLDSITPSKQTTPSPYHITRGSNFPRNSRNWAVRRDHNHLRITRILRSLRVLGLQRESEAFYVALRDVFDDPSVRISNDSMMYWTRAAERPLYVAPDGDRCAWLRKWEEEGDQKEKKKMMMMMM